jgi:LPXTG-motif cell wall-anchored protein
MEDFTLFSETPCKTLQKLKLKGITQNSNYIKNLEAACDQKKQPVKSLTSKNNILIIAGVSTAILGLIAFLIYVNKKK